MSSRPTEFVDAADAVRRSLLIRTVASIVSGIETAAAKSETVRLLRRVRITHIGVVITSTCVTHTVLLRLMPDRLVPAKPLAYGMVLAFAALVMAAGRITTRSSATATAESSAGTANAMKS